MNIFNVKRGVAIVVFLVIVMSSLAVAAEPSVTLGPLEFYETNDISFSINVSNYQNDHEINSVKLLASGFDITSLVNYIGWTEEFNNSHGAWSDGSLGNNVVLALFEYSAQAPRVDSDTESPTTVTLVDSDDQEHDYTFDLVVLNDETPPQLTDIVPYDGAFVKEGTTDQHIKANATDPETGIDNVQFSWVRCNFEGNITPEEHTAQLAENSGLFQAEIDLSSYENEQQVCFDFTAYNNGGESTSYNGTLTVDGVPPEVTLVSPDDGATIGLGQEFSFFAADNLAQVLQCGMSIDGTEYMTDIAAENMEVVSIPSADVEEGQHTWSIRCADPAGWYGESATRSYTLDKTPPRIEMTAPANNSIIADSTLLEFEVTDDHGLQRVWYVLDGNETDVTEKFSIDITGWPEGPSEFAVIAEDPAGNQAEQTYRIIVDRTPPQVEPVSPEDNGSSDVHVEYKYTVLDNYDDEMDCRVFLDDNGLESHTAQGGAETVWKYITAIGEHRWNVQCVDDAGNIGISDERRVNVIDTTGPDITANSPDLVYRGDPVTISLDVTDISGVEAVTAELRGPDDTIQSVPLEKDGSTYTGSVPTTLSSVLGSYTVKVYAVDTLNNSNTAEEEIILTYRYMVAMELDPATTITGSAVNVNGVVTYDNGSMVPEDSVLLQLPGNATEDVAMDESGGFSFTFTAPANAGVYEITASVYSEDNSQTYEDKEQLTVTAPQPTTSSYSGGGGGGHGGTYSSSNKDDGGGCSTDWSCTAWTTCSDGWQERTCVDMNKCDTGDAKRIETRSCTTRTEDGYDDTTTERDAVSPAREPLPEPEEYEIDATEKDQGDAAGIGKASSFMSRLDLRMSSMIIALLLMAIILATLYRYGWSKGDRRKTPAAIDILSSRGHDKLGLESYLDERMARKGRL